MLGIKPRLEKSRGSNQQVGGGTDAHLPGCPSSRHGIMKWSSCSLAHIYQCLPPGGWGKQVNGVFSVPPRQGSREQGVHCPLFVEARDSSKEKQTALALASRGGGEGVKGTQAGGLSCLPDFICPLLPQK